MKLPIVVMIGPLFVAVVECFGQPSSQAPGISQLKATSSNAVKVQ